MTFHTGKVPGPRYLHVIPISETFYVVNSINMSTDTQYFTLQVAAAWFDCVQIFIWFFVVYYRNIFWFFKAAFEVPVEFKKFYHDSVLGIKSWICDGKTINSSSDPNCTTLADGDNSSRVVSLGDLKPYHW